MNDLYFSRTVIKPPKIINPSIEGDYSNRLGDYQSKLYVLGNKIEDSFPEEILEKFDLAGLKPWKFRFFVWNKDSMCGWHRDTGKSTVEIGQSAINWVVKGKGKIQWSLNDDVSPYYSIENKIDQIATEVDGHGCLVNTEKLHRVVVGPEGRDTISLLWERPEPSFNEVQDRLRSVGLIKEK